MERDFPSLWLQGCPDFTSAAPFHGTPCSSWWPRLSMLLPWRVGVAWHANHHWVGGSEHPEYQVTGSQYPTERKVGDDTMPAPM